MAEFAVFDAHVHIQPWKMIKPEALALFHANRGNVSEIFDMMYDPVKLLRHLDRERVERVVSMNYISPDIMGFTEEVNRFAAWHARESGGRVIAIGSVHPLFSRDPDREVARLVADGIRGIKIHPPHQGCAPNAYRTGNRTIETIYRRAEEDGLVVILHTGTSVFPGARNVYADPILCDDVAVDFPALKIVLAHGGRPLWMQTAVFLLRRHPNVWIDVSSIPPQKLLEYFPRLEEFADKVLWGTDWPAPGVPGMRENVERFVALDLSDAAKQKILYENAIPIYGGP